MRCPPRGGDCFYIGDRLVLSGEQRSILLEHLRMQMEQLLPGLQAELASQCAPGAGKRVECVRLPAGPVQRQHQLGVKAFTDYAPVTYTDANGLYRSFRWGRNLELFFLDERSFRDAKASANHVCDNPQTHQPDLAPTAPQHTRNTFALLVPSLAQPVSPACIQKIKGF